MRQSKMKILIITSFYPPYHVGGACLHAYYLANALGRAGHKVTVVSSLDAYMLVKGKNPAENGFSNHENVNVIFMRSKVKNAAALFSYLTGSPPGKKIRKIIGMGYDVIHYHNISLFGPAVLKYGKAKKIYTLHDHWLVCQLNSLYRNGQPCPITNSAGNGSNTTNLLFHCLPHIISERRPIQMWRFGKLLAESINFVDIFLTPSEYMRMIAYKSGITKPIVTIPNFINDPGYNGTGKRDYFLFTGRLEDNKGIMSLVEAFRQSEEKLVIAGDGALFKKIKKMRLKNIRLLGWVPVSKMPNLYDRAKATVIPSRSPENFPTVALESYSRGIPVIGSNIGGIREIVRLVDESLLFIPGNVPMIKDIINKFSIDSYHREQIRKIFLDNFTEKQFMNKYQELL
jgi:glycosyltransferase involved in cell wall biosynthesis